MSYFQRTDELTPEISRLREFGSLEFAVTLIAGLATTLMLQATRVFLGYTVFVIDQDRRGLIAVTAFGVFAVFILGGVAAWVLRARRAVVVTAAMLIVARLILQFTEHPETRLALGGVAIVAWGWMLPSLRAIRPDDAARGVVYGLLLDLAIRFGFGTVDLPWMPTALRHTATVLLTFVLICGLVLLLRARGVVLSGGAGPSLIGVGPAIAVFHLLIGNIGIAEMKSDLPVQMTVFLAAIGIAAGFAMQIRTPELTAAGQPMARGWAVALVLTAIGAIGLVVFWRWNSVADLFLMMVSGVAAQLLVISIRGRGLAGEPPGIMWDGVWLTIGMLLHTALIFIYYTATGFPILIGVSLALLGIGAALAAVRSTPLPPMASGRHLPAMLVLALVLLALGLFANRSAWEEVDRDDVLGAELTVMTYNLQTGFSLDHTWDLERQARVIESHQPDIVLLQEVSRGWIITSAVDEARWLSNRLDMNLIWGPSSRDDLWGVVILTRGNIQGSEMRIFDTTENLQRGVLGAAISSESGPIYVYNTHLDDPTEGGAVRFEQVTQLLSAAEGASPAILGGDFNAPPDSDVVGAVLSAGFVDTGASLPPDVTTRDGALRIDYIFVRGPFRVDEILVSDETASDHKPVVTRVTLQQ